MVSDVFSVCFVRLVKYRQTSTSDRRKKNNSDNKTVEKCDKRQYIFKRKGQIFTAVKFPIWCPLVLLVKISWRQVGLSETKESNEIESEQFEHRAEEGSWVFGLNFEFCISQVASLTLCYVHKTVQRVTEPLKT